jgi:hypothetical protein
MAEKSEKKVICPKNPKWLRGMLSVLPEGLRGKLAPYDVCLREVSEETNVEKMSPEEIIPKEEKRVEELETEVE